MYSQKGAERSLQQSNANEHRLQRSNQRLRLVMFHIPRRRSRTGRRAQLLLLPLLPASHVGQC